MDMVTDNPEISETMQPSDVVWISEYSVKQLELTTREQDDKNTRTPSHVDWNEDKNHPAPPLVSLVPTPYGLPYTSSNLHGPELEYNSDDEIPPLTHQIFDDDSDDNIQDITHQVPNDHDDSHDGSGAYVLWLNRTPYRLPDAPSQIVMTDHNSERDEVHTPFPPTELQDDDTDMPGLETIPPGEDTYIIGWNPAYSQIDLTHFDDRLVLTPEDWSTATQAMAQLDLHPGTLLFPKSMLNGSPLIVTIPGDITNKIYPSGGTFVGTKLRGHFVAIPSCIPGLHIILLDHRMIRRAHGMLRSRYAVPIIERDSFRATIIRHVRDLIHAYF